MFFHNLSSSLLPAALALTLSAALPAFAQTEIEPTVKAAESHGPAHGVWVPASPGTPGGMHGLLLDGRGRVRFEIRAITHAIVPSEIPDYAIGTLYGRLLSARLQDETAQGEGIEPLSEPASIYVVGSWSVYQVDGSGHFTAVAYVQFSALPMPLVLLDIAGAFRVPATNPPQALSLAEKAIAAPLREPEPEFVVCYAGPNLFNPKRIADLAKRVGSHERAAESAYLQGAGGDAALASSASHAVRFHARWMTRD